MLQRDQPNIFVRQVQVPLDSQFIKAFYDLPAVINYAATCFWLP